MSLVAANAGMFSFEFSNSRGNVPGTVTGTILLHDGDETASAAPVLIEHCPQYLIDYHYPETQHDAMSGPSHHGSFNTFTMVGAEIQVSEVFQLMSHPGGYGIEPALNSAPAGSDHVLFDEYAFGQHGDWDAEATRGMNGFAGAKLQAFASPAPAADSTLLAGTVLVVAGGAFRRKLVSIKPAPCQGSVTAHAR
jgi:hypothetical protein